MREAQATQIYAGLDKRRPLHNGKYTNGFSEEFVHVEEIDMSFDIIRKTVRHLVDLIANRRYDLVLQACSKSRLTEDDMEHILNVCGVHAVLSPEDADQYIDTVAIKDGSVPTW